MSQTTTGIRSLNSKIESVERDINSLKELVAAQNIDRIKKAGIVNELSQVEFKVYSQRGEDGIIQYLLNNIEIPEKNFVEFGVENYKEANTRFLLKNNNWSGLVIDGSEKNIEVIKKDKIYWEHNLNALAAFITSDNINSLIESAGFKGEIGLLSIDIDGNDYWIWENLNVVHPIIIICEYNSVFGKDRAITIPYKADFYQKDYHYSCLYFGASLRALTHLADKKGYAFVGSNSIGSNAFFVRKDKVGQLKIIDPENGYVESKFRSSRNADGELNFLSSNDRLNLIKGMPVINVLSGLEETL